jgi:large repetitive protein
MTSIFCSDNDSGGTLTGLTVGNTYRIRLFTYASSGNTVQNICIVAGPAAPANDNCATATSFPPIPTNGNCSNLLNQSTSGASNSAVTPSGICTTNFGTPDDDVWFTFVATATTHIMSATFVSGLTDVYWQVFSSNCAATMTSIFCSDNDAGGTLTGLTIGNTYRIRLYTYATTGNTVQNICLQTVVAPPNDNPCTATTVPVNTTFACSATIGGTVFNATPTGTALGACGGTADDDVWFMFTATQTSMGVNLLDVTGSTTDLYHSVFAGTCSSLGAALVCSDNNNSVVTGLTVGNIYWVRVYTFTATTGQNSTFKICIAPVPPLPTNINCGAPKPLCSGSPIVFTANTGNPPASTVNPGNTYGCLSTSPNPSWYYMKIATSGNIAVDITAGSDIDFALWGPYATLPLAAGACNSYPAPIDCSYSSSAVEQANISSVVAGQIYVLLVTNYASTVQTVTVKTATSNTATTDCSIVPLSATFGNVTAAHSEQGGLISWFTYAEQNSSHFDVMHSTDGTTWEKVKTVGAAFNSTEIRNYSIFHERLSDGENYYKIDEYDVDHSITESNIVHLYKAVQGVSVFPNPSNGVFNISSTSDIQSIEVTDLNGVKVFSTGISNTGTTINLEQLSKGTYFINVITKFTHYIERIIIK